MDHVLEVLKGKFTINHSKFVTSANNDLLISDLKTKHFLPLNLGDKIESESESCWKLRAVDSQRIIAFNRETTGDYLINVETKEVKGFAKGRGSKYYFNGILVYLSHVALVNYYGIYIWNFETDKLAKKYKYKALNRDSQLLYHEESKILLIFNSYTLTGFKIENKKIRVKFKFNFDIKYERPYDLLLLPGTNKFVSRNNSEVSVWNFGNTLQRKSPRHEIREEIRIHSGGIGQIYNLAALTEERIAITLTRVELDGVKNVIKIYDISGKGDPSKEEKQVIHPLRQNPPLKASLLYYSGEFPIDPNKMFQLLETNQLYVSILNACFTIDLDGLGTEKCLAVAHENFDLSGELAVMKATSREKVKILKVVLNLKLKLSLPKDLIGEVFDFLN